MPNKAAQNANQSQSDKFKAAAKEHGADTSVRRWDERMKKIAKAKTEKSD